MFKTILFLAVCIGAFYSVTIAQISTSSFASGINFSTGTTSTPSPTFSSVGDLDGDGKLELVIPNSGESYITIYRNVSTPGTINSSSLSSKMDVASLSTPGNICISDMDGDGKLDVIIFYSSPLYFSVLRNVTTSIGSITFGTRQDYATPSSGFGAVVDLDNDGKPDLVHTDYYNNLIHVFRNSTSTIGTITFGTVQNFATAGGPACVIATDFDGDNKNDIAVTNYSGTGANTVYVYHNLTTVVGSILLSTPTSLVTGSLPNGLTCMDVDGDSKQDIIAANYNGGTISVFRNTCTAGTLSFATQVVFSTTGSLGPQGMGSADLDGDGKMDLVVGNLNSTNNVSVFRNTSTIGNITTSSFATRVDFSTGAWNQPVVCDLDNDLKPDIISINKSSNNVTVLRNLVVYAIAPTNGGSTMNFSGIQNTRMTVNFNKGNGSRRIVLCKSASAISAAPVSGTYYSANSAFGSGSQIGTGNYVVYSDTGNSFTLTGLTPNTTYYFAVFEYNGVGGFANYLTSAFSYLTGSQNTTNITYYYSKSTGNLNTLGTWGTNTDGSGSSPTSFSTSNSYYFAVNNSSPTLNGNLTITGGNTAMIIGEGINTYNFTIPAGYTLTTDTFVLKKFSTVSVNGTLAGPINVFEDTSTAQYLGSTTQTIVTGSYYNLIVGSSVKTLNNGNVIARNSLTLMSAINLNGYSMMIGTSTSQLGTLNYVSGTIYGGTLWRWFGTTANTGSSGLFPIGTTTSYRPVQINYTTAPTTGGALSAIFQSTVPNNTGLPVIDILTTPIITINKMGNSGTWILTPGALTGGQFTATVTGTGFYGVSSYADLRMLRRNNSSSAWTNTNAGTAQISTGTNSAPVVSRIGMNAYGEFGIGGDSTSNALPVKIIILTVRQKDAEAILNWETASENNSDHFTIIRSTDNRTWEEIGSIGASGITNDVRKYSYTDKIGDLMTWNEKEVYYRLEQVDRDGTRMNSEVVVLDIQNGLNRITLYPLPLNNILTATSTNGTEIKSITILDLRGRELMSSINGMIDVTQLPVGMYIAKIETHIDCYYLKVVK